MSRQERRKCALFTSVMKQKYIALIGLLLSISSIVAANPVIPERQSLEHYEKITDDWPFSIETPSVPVPVHPEGPFTNFYVAGIGKTNANGQEQVFVAISSKDKQVSFSLFGSEKGYDDIWVVDVQWDDQIGKSRVTLKKGNETGIIGFAEMAIKAPAPAAKNPLRPAGTLNSNSIILKLPQRTPGANSPAQPNQGTDPAHGQRVRVIR